VTDRSWWRPWSTVAVLAAVVVPLSWMMRGVRNDDAYMTYRYAQNLSLGRGFVFNPGEAVLATTAPGHGLLLAVSTVVSDDVVANALILGAVAAIALGACMRAAVDDETRRAGFFAAITVATAPMTYLLFPLETILVTALCWGTVLAAHKTMPRMFGALAGLATVVRADAALCALAVAAVLVIDREGRAFLRRAVVPGLWVAGPWFAFASLYYGAPLSSTASTKVGWSGHAWTYGSKLWERGIAPMFGSDTAAALAVTLAMIGAVFVFRDRRARVLRAIPVWMGMHFVAYSGMRILWPHHWYYFPLGVGVIVLACRGAVELLRRFRGSARARTTIVTGAGLSLGAVWVANLVELLDVRERIEADFFVAGRDGLYRDAAAWIRERSTPSDVVALAEPGTLAYFADRPVVDMMGLVTPAIGEAMKEAGGPLDPAWITRRYDPRFVLLLPRKEAVPAASLPGDPRYHLAIQFERAETDRKVVVYERVADSSAD
jgi:arabinofuranosyltransferase